MSEQDRRLESLEATVRALGATATQVAGHEAKIQYLEGEDDDLKALIGQRADRQDRLLEAVLAQVKETNGRVTELEQDRVKVEAARVARAEVVEQLRVARAWRPTATVTVIIALVLLVLTPLMSLAVQTLFN